MIFEVSVVNAARITREDPLSPAPDGVRLEHEAHGAQVQDSARFAAQRVTIRGTTVEEVDEVFVKNVARHHATQFVTSHDVGQNLATRRVDER